MNSEIKINRDEKGRFIKYTSKEESEEHSRYLKELYKKGIMKPSSSCFKKGHTPWHKGKQLPEELRKRMNKSKIGKSPWNKGLKGIHFSEKTEFKKGNIPWNKDKEYKEIQWEKHINFKSGYTRYVQFVIRNGIKPICYICKKKGTFGRKIHVHHNDGDKNNNALENLMILCSKCHANIHKNWEKKSICLKIV